MGTGVRIDADAPSRADRRPGRDAARRRSTRTKRSSARRARRRAGRPSLDPGVVPWVRARGVPTSLEGTRTKDHPARPTESAPARVRRRDDRTGPRAAPAQSPSSDQGTPRRRRRGSSRDIAVTPCRSSRSAPASPGWQNALDARETIRQRRRDAAAPQQSSAPVHGCGACCSRSSWGNSASTGSTSARSAPGSSSSSPSAVSASGGRSTSS